MQACNRIWEKVDSVEGQSYITYFRSNPLNPVAPTETHSAHTIENLTEIYKT
jgi:hypothetical protein